MDKIEWLEKLGVPRNRLVRRVAQVPPGKTSGAGPTGRPAKTPPPAPVLVSITVTLAAPLKPNGQQQLTATGKFSDDSTRDLTSAVKWSSDTTIVNVAPGGLAKVGSGSGKVTITAAAAGGGASGSITVMIRLPLQDIRVTPENPLVEIGDTQGLTATAVFTDGDTEDITDKVVWEVWKSSKPKAVDFVSAGVCVAAAAGTATVTARDPASGIFGATKITVPAVGKAPALRKVTISPLNPEIKDGSPVPFKATGVYADGSTHEITDKVKWESSDPKTLSIDAKGVARAGLVSGSGHPLISGTDPSTGRYQATTCYVEMPGVQSVTLSPKTLTLISGDAAPVTAKAALFGGGEMTVNAHVTWTIVDPAVAKMILGGEQVEGLAPGSTAIEAFESESESHDSIDVTVLPPVLRSIMVMGSDTLRIDQTEQYTATGFFSDHTSKDLTGLKWSSSEPARIDINQKTGEATAKTAGKATITAEDPATHKTGTIEVEAKAPTP